MVMKKLSLLWFRSGAGLKIS